MAVIALDLGGTKLAGALFSARGEIIQDLVVQVDGRRGRTVGALIRDRLGALLEAAQARRLAVSAIGVSIPGIAYADSGVVWAPNIPGWRRYPLYRELQAVLADKRTPVVIENDRACSILGEAWKGQAQGCRNAIFIAVGTGIGAGILVDGQVLRGTSGIAGSIGWLALQRPFRADYTSCGCFEYHASGEGLVKVARELAQLGNGSRRPLRSAQSPWLSAHDVFRAYHQRNPVARQAVGQAIQFWGMAVANLVSIFNPEKIIFGGGVFGPATRFLSGIHREARKWGQPISMRQVELAASKLGPAAALQGAAFLALNR